MKALASVILAAAVAVSGTLASRGDLPVDAAADGIAEAAEANGDVVSAAVRAVLAHVREEAPASTWADVAFNPDRGEYLAIHAAGGGVRGRRYDRRGTPVAASFAIAAAAPGPAIAPRVAYDPGTRRYLVVWVREAGKVEAVRLDAAGAAVSRIFPVPPGGGLSMRGHDAPFLAQVFGRPGDIAAGMR